MECNIEMEFNNYLQYVVEVEDCKIEIAALKEDATINPIAYEERATSNKISNPTMDKMFNKEAELRNYTYKLKEAQKKIDKMDNAVRILSDLEREVIKLNYCHSPKLNKKQIQIKLFLSSVSVYRIRCKALKKMEVCFIGQ